MLHIVHPDGAVVPIAEVIGYVLAPWRGELPDAGAEGRDASAGAEAAKAPKAESAGAVGAARRRGGFRCRA